MNWAKSGKPASSLDVIEIADPRVKPFPGYDRLLVNFDELQSILEDDSYSQWQTALSSVQGIYLIADTKSGQLYVGKADGNERFLGRWNAYARTGHGGNVALRELAAIDLSHPQHFQFSILQVFSPERTGNPGRCHRSPLQKSASYTAVRLQPQLTRVDRAQNTTPETLP